MSKTAYCVVTLFSLLFAGAACAQGVLEVREGSASGTLISDDEAVGGLRDLGFLPVSTNSPPLTCYFTNVGSSPITFGAYSKTGANPSQFFVIDWAAFTNPLPVGQTTSLTILFYTSTAGVSTATLNLPHDATGSGTSFQINMRAEAVLSPQMKVILVPGVWISHNASPVGTALNFGNLDAAAGPSPTVTIELTNTGSSTLTLLTPQLAGLGSNDFVLDTTGTALSLAPDQTTTFEVAFDPTSAGLKDAVIQIFHNNNFQPSPFLVPVTGVGTATNTGSGDNDEEGCTTSEGSGTTLQALALCCAVACLFRLRRRNRNSRISV